MDEQQIKAIVEQADDETFMGLVWDAERDAYRITDDADPGWWQDDLAGLEIDESGERYISGDVVSETAATRRVSNLVDAGLDHRRAALYR